MTNSETRRRVDELGRLAEAGILSWERFLDMAVRAFQLATPDPMFVGPDGRIISRAQEKPMQTGATVETGQTPLAVGQIRSENGAQYLVTRKCPEDRWDIEWLDKPGEKIRGNHASRFLICDPVVKETAVVSAEKLTRVTATEPREPTMEDMKAFASDPYNHHDWAKYLPREAFKEETGHELRTGDVWACCCTGTAGSVRKIGEVDERERVGAMSNYMKYEILAGNKAGFGSMAMDSEATRSSRLIARMENGVLRLVPGVGIDNPAVKYQDTAVWPGDPNLRPAPKPNFHGVKLGEYRKTRLGWARVMAMDANLDVCRVKFYDNHEEKVGLEWISRQGVSNLPPAPARPRCKTGTACKSPADAPLGYLGLCWPCALDGEKRIASETADVDGRTKSQRAWRGQMREWQASLLAQTYDNSRSAGIGVAGTIWKLRG